MADYHVVIPARFASTRLPGKPLATIGGIPMIVRVATRAAQAGAQSVVVATDDKRIVDVVKEAGFEVMMTREDHRSGSDRAMEVAESLGWCSDDIVVNVQGDEPLIPPSVIDQVAGLIEETGYGVATLCEKILDPAELFDPNVVKVALSATSRALYFSRAPIPYARGFFDQVPVLLPDTQPWWRHIGIYAYRVAALRTFVDLPQSALERTEALEQLRLLANDIDIGVAQALEPVPGGVDTLEDLYRMEQLV
ncbi:MAG: 3-deoxy-manno-octulosonate cytidylyltransferase [Proteobacteria bacterium]|nr:3-deoxy-manno-octulosonate cytidylyltransferase [Pseudomonadota bacterium]